MKDQHKITRLEIVDRTGRTARYHAEGLGEITLEQQDGGSTLKVYVQGILKTDASKRVELLEEALRKCHSSMDALNDGGFGPLTRKEDIDAMLNAAKLLNIE